MRTYYKREELGIEIVDWNWEQRKTDNIIRK